MQAQIYYHHKFLIRLTMKDLKTEPSHKWHMQPRTCFVKYTFGYKVLTILYKASKVIGWIKMYDTLVFEKRR